MQATKQSYITWSPRSGSPPARPHAFIPTSGDVLRSLQMTLSAFKRWVRTKPRGRISPFHYLTGRCPKGMPAGEWNTIRMPVWTIWILSMPTWSCGVVSLLMLLHWEGFISIGHVPSAGTMALWSSGGVVAGVLLWTVMGMRKRRFLRAVVALRFEVCLSCGYNLIGLPGAHQCPECGSAYDKERVSQTWRVWFGEGGSSGDRDPDSSSNR